MMNAWILIVAFASVASAHPDGVATSTGTKRSYHVAMQEFSDLQACQHASIEAHKIAPGIRAVCVPKAVKQ